MRALLTTTVTLLSLAGAAPAGAGDAPPDDAGAITGKLELGYLATSGNTETSSLNAKLTLGWEARRWRHAVEAAAVRAEDSGATTAERYQLGAKSDYQINEHDYLFVTVRWEQDEFAGFSQRTSEAVGYGRRLLSDPDHHLDLEIGVGARQTEPLAGPDGSETIVRLAGRYKWFIAEGATFDQSVTVEQGDANTYAESVSALSAKLRASWSLRLSYTIKYNSEVAVGLENTDTYTAVGVEYAF